MSMDRFVQPPAEGFVPQGATLYANIISTYNAAETVTISYRMADIKTGLVRDQQEICTIPTSTTNQQFNIQANMPECFLIGVSVLATVAKERGVTYVNVRLKGKDGKHLTTFVRGYVTKSEGISFPPIFLESSASGSGREGQTYVYGAPAYLFTVPVKKFWRLRSIATQLITTAVVGDRIVRIEITAPGSTGILTILASHSQPASTTQFYGFVREGGSRQMLQTAGNADWYVATDLGYHELAAGYTVLVNVLDLLAGDAHGPCTLRYEELQAPDM